MYKTQERAQLPGGGRGQPHAHAHEAARRERGADVRVGMQLDTTGRVVSVKRVVDGGLAAAAGIQEG